MGCEDVTRQPDIFAGCIPFACTIPRLMGPAEMVPDGRQSGQEETQNLETIAAECSCQHQPEGKEKKEDIGCNVEIGDGRHGLVGLQEE